MVGNERFSHQTVLEQLDSHKCNNELRLLYYTIYKIALSIEKIIKQ